MLHFFQVRGSKIDQMAPAGLKFVPRAPVRMSINLKSVSPNIFRRFVFEGFDQSKVTPRRRIDENVKI